MCSTTETALSVFLCQNYAEWRVLVTYARGAIDCVAVAGVRNKERCACVAVRVAVTCLLLHSL